MLQIAPMSCINLRDLRNLWMNPATPKLNSLSRHSDDVFFKPVHNRDVAIAASVFALALAVRLMFLFTSPDRAWPHSILYQGDAFTWVEWARALKDGAPFEFDLPLRSPAVAYLLHWISGGSLAGPFTSYKVLWCAISALGCALAYLAFASVSARRVSLIAAGLCVFSFGSYITATSLNNEAIYTTSLMGIALATVQLIRRPRLWLAILLGVLHGAAMLTRAEHMLLLTMLLAYMAWKFDLLHYQTLRLIFAPSPQSKIQNPKSKFAILTVILAGSIVICLPWSIRGSLATHRFNTISADVPDFQSTSMRWEPEARAVIDSLPAFARDPNFRYLNHLGQTNEKKVITRHDVLDFFHDQFDYVPEPLSNWTFLSLKGPVDFALANHPASDGGFSKAALIRAQEPGEIDPTIRLARPDHLKLFNHGYSIGWHSITSDVGGWLGLVRAKLRNFADGVALGFTSANLPVGLNGQRRAVDVFTASPRDSFHKFIDGAWRVLLILLLVFGVLIALQRPGGGLWLLIIAYKIIITVLFYGYARQAVSILPAFYLLMALPIDFLFGRIARRMKNATRAPLAVAMVLVALAVVFDVLAARNRPDLRPVGNLHPAPQWGKNAFDAAELIELPPSRTK